MKKIIVIGVILILSVTVFTTILNEKNNDSITPDDNSQNNTPPEPDGDQNNTPPEPLFNNFSSNGTFYYDIGDKTVTVDSFVRWPGQKTHNPSFGEAVLLSQCIDYKKAHPNEEVYMTCTSFHLLC